MVARSRWYVRSQLCHVFKLETFNEELRVQGSVKDLSSALSETIRGVSFAILEETFPQSRACSTFEY